MAALGMMPLWIFVLGSRLSDGDLVIPYGQLMMTLVTLIGPITLGMWIRFRFVKGAKIMKLIIVPFTLLTVLFIFTVGVYINLFIFMLMTAKMVAAGFLIAILGIENRVFTDFIKSYLTFLFIFILCSGYSFGAGFAWLCRFANIHSRYT